MDSYRHAYALATFLFLMRVDAGQGRTRLHIGGMYPTTFNHLLYSEQGYHALHLAISHVNSNAHILPYHELVLLLNDSKVSSFWVFVWRLDTCARVAYFRDLLLV